MTLAAYQGWLGDLERGHISLFGHLDTWNVTSVEQGLERPLVPKLWSNEAKQRAWKAKP